MSLVYHFFGTRCIVYIPFETTSARLTASYGYNLLAVAGRG